MHFGWYLNPETQGPEHDRARIREAIEQCERAEALGYTAIWITEHHFTGYNAYSDAIVMAANLAARTRTARLGFSVAVPALHHPVTLAEQFSLLDNLSDGRLIVGVGSGFGAVEFDGFGKDIKQRHALFDESVDLMFRVWGHQEGRLEYETERFRGTINGRIIPAPVQRPTPLVARATVHTEFAERWGAMGHPILYPPWSAEHLQAMAEAHERGLAQAAVPEERKNQARAWSPMLMTVYVGEGSDEQAFAEFEPYAEQHIISQRRANHVGTFTSIADVDPDWVADWKANKMIAASAETVVGKLRAFGERGIEHVMIWMNTGGIPHEMVLASQERFARQVMPALADVKPSGTRVQPVEPAFTNFDG